MSDRMLALRDRLHDERNARRTQRSDCWACEAARSDALAALVAEVEQLQGLLRHHEMVLARAVPDEAARLELWRAHWREQLALHREQGVARDPGTEVRRG